VILVKGDHLRKQFLRGKHVWRVEDFRKKALKWKKEEGLVETNQEGI